MIKEHDRVVLTKAVAEEGLEAGDVGTVVHLYGDGNAYESNLSRWMVTPLLLPRSKHRMLDRSPAARVHTRESWRRRE